MMVLNKKDVTQLLVFPFIIFVVNWFFTMFFVMEYIALGIDTPMHVLGGFSIANSAAYVIYLAQKENAMIIKNGLLKIIVIIAFVCLTAVLWELYEFIHDMIFGTNFVVSSYDTTKDLIMGALGGIIYCVIFFKKINLK